jgi:hypothetical protein
MNGRVSAGYRATRKFAPEMALSGSAENDPERKTIVGHPIPLHPTARHSTSADGRPRSGDVTRGLVLLLVCECRECSAE